MKQLFIKYSKNYNNKLMCEYYTTIRKSNPDKYKIGFMYYATIEGHQGADHKAKLLEKRTIALKDLPTFTAYLDTGLNTYDTINLFQDLYPDDDVNTLKVDILLFKNLEFQQFK